MAVFVDPRSVKATGGVQLALAAQPHSLCRREKDGSKRGYVEVELRLMGCSLLAKQLLHSSHPRTSCAATHARV